MDFRVSRRWIVFEKEGHEPPGAGCRERWVDVGSQSIDVGNSVLASAWCGLMWVDVTPDCDMVVAFVLRCHQSFTVEGG